MMIKKEQNVTESLFAKALQAKKKIGAVRRLIKGPKKDGESYVNPDLERRAEYQRIIGNPGDLMEEEAAIVKGRTINEEIKEEEDDNDLELEEEDEKEIQDILDLVYKEAEIEAEEIEENEKKMAEGAIEELCESLFEEMEKEEAREVPWETHEEKEKEETKEISIENEEIEKFVNDLVDNLTENTEEKNKREEEAKVRGNEENCDGARDQRKLSSSFRSQAMRRFSLGESASGSIIGFERKRASRGNHNNSKNYGIDLSIEPIEIHSNPYISTPSHVTNLTPKDPLLAQKSLLSSGLGGSRAVALKESIIEQKVEEDDAPLKQIQNEDQEKKKKGKEKKQTVPLLGPYRRNEQNLRVPTEAELMHMENPSGYHINLLKPDGIYTDSAFPPCPMSLLRNSRKTRPGLNHWKSFSWSRLSALFGLSNINICSEIKPTSFSHGAIRNHYFLSVLSALAENPTRIRRLFGAQEENKFGVYHVLINLRGIWRNVVVDDMFPVASKEKQELAFCSIKSPAADGTIPIWPMLLEKAWAKVFQNYENIAEHMGNSVAKVLRDLTGAPSYTYSHKQGAESDLWRVLEEGYTKKHILIAETSNGEKDACCFFTVLQVAKSTKRQKCVRLRNYQMKLEPQAEVNSNELEAEYSSTLRSISALRNNGSTGQREEWSKLKENESVLEFKEFSEKCSKVHVCVFQESWEYESIVVRHQRNAYSIVSFDVEEDSTQGFFEISQIDEQFYGETLINKGFYKYSPARLFIVKYIEEKDEYELIDGAFSMGERTTFVPLDLKRGKYFVLVAVDWGPKIFDIVLNYYTSQKLKDLQRVDIKLLDFLYTDSFFHFTLVNGTPEELSSSGDLTKFTLHKPEWGLWVIVFLNKAAQAIEISAPFAQKNDVKVDGSLSNNQLQVFVGPGDTQGVFVKFTGPHPEFSIGPCGFLK